MRIQLSPEVQDAIATQQPVVALESTVISHGLPYPQNIELAQEMELLVRDEGAIPATIAMIDGVPTAGLTESNLMRLADGKTPVRKLSRRDLGGAVANKEMGATTVASTMLFAHWAGIRIFATGGIGGVHHGDSGDVSADLVELSQTPVAVVCAGAKSILDLPRTLEWLETFGVPVVGYGTSEFPAFYTRSSGLDLVDRVDSPADAASLLSAHWGLGLPSGVLLTVPVPEAESLAAAKIDTQIMQALDEADAQRIRGRDTTPFLLSRLVELTDGDSLKTNLELLKNNGRTAAKIAVAFATRAQS